MNPKEIQEWLNLHGYRVAIDGVLGPVTQAALAEFADKYGFVLTDEAALCGYLAAPLSMALMPLKEVPATLGEAVVLVAQQHLRQHPREVGGENRGPWVRYYSGGVEGDDCAWCAWCVSALLRQALQEMGLARNTVRIDSYSCDVLAQQAKISGRFVEGGKPVDVKPGDLFLVRGKKPGDWIHTGIVIGVSESGVQTIEGNTNDEGHREGYEVCERRRGYAKLDFIRI